MSRRRLMLLSLVAALSAIGGLATTASAKINFEWLVLLSGGINMLLAKGETRAFTASSGGKDIVLSATVGATKTELLSTNLSIEKGLINGGKPGTNEGVAVFTGVKVVKPLFEGKEVCAANSPGEPAGTIKTVLLKSEIVEDQESREPLILFTPKAGANFAEIEFTQKEPECVIKGLKVAVAGSVLALPLPHLGHVLTLDLDFEAKSKEFLLSPGGGTIEKSGLSIGGKPATLTALALLLLTTHELFGIC